MKARAALQHPARTSFPLTLAEMRDACMDAAGFEPEAVGAFMRKSVEKLIQKLDARTTKIISFEGVVTDTVEVEDNAAQIKAASELISLGADVMGLKRRVTENDGGTKTPITIDLSGWTVNTPPGPKVEDPAQ